MGNAFDDGYVTGFDSCQTVDEAVKRFETAYSRSIKAEQFVEYGNIVNAVRRNKANLRLIKGFSITNPFLTGVERRHLKKYWTEMCKNKIWLSQLVFLLSISHMKKI
jgi:hypothetical protein